MVDRYDVARICEKGHVINDALRIAPGKTTDFCGYCGAKGIDHCPHCNSDIRGASIFPNINGDWMIGQHLIPSAFCRSCGRPFPWTEAKMKAAREMVDELEELTSEEKTKLNQSLDVLISNAPEQQLAGMRAKKVFMKIKKETYEACKSVLTEVLSEAAKKVLFGPTS